VELVVVLCCDKATEQEGQELDCAAWNLEVLSSESVEAEGADDDGGELYCVSI
jgi:hypothetical protein